MKSEELHIQITEAGSVKVALTFKAKVAEHLTDLIPPDLLPKIEAQGLDLEKITQEIIASNFEPQDIFCLELPEHQKSVRVWLK